MECSLFIVDKTKETDTKENGKKVRKKVKEFTIGKMEQDTKENGKEVKVMGMEF